MQGFRAERQRETRRRKELVDGFEVLAAAEVVDEERHRFVGVSEVRVREEPLVEAENCTAGFGREIESGEDERRRWVDVRELEVEAFGDRKRVGVRVIKELRGNRERNGIIRKRRRGRRRREGLEMGGEEGEFGSLVVV